MTSIQSNIFVSITEIHEFGEWVQKIEWKQGGVSGSGWRCAEMGVQFWLYITLTFLFVHDVVAAVVAVVAAVLDNVELVKV